MEWAGHYRLNPDHSVEPFEIKSEADLIEWARGLGRKDWRVGYDKIAPGISVSTIFLGLDHNFRMHGPPLLFETMVFTDYGGEEMWRWSTWDEAAAAHQRIVTDLTKKIVSKWKAEGERAGPPHKDLK